MLESLFNLPPIPKMVVKIVLVVVAIITAFAAPGFGEKWFKPIERAFSRLARRRSLSILMVGVIVLIGRAAILPINPPGVPAVHDEFSYLLQADTFASGRLTNPTHPMWVHFETMHIIHQPTYASKYPPAQALVLAAGKVIAGHPWVGVWISYGLMFSAICWMLQGWLPPGWALLGALMAITKLGLFNHWATGYWGGAVAAIGGALILGALPRIMRRLRLRDGLIMGMGLAIVANSRPYEGLLLSLPVGLVLLIWSLRQRRCRLTVLVVKVALPICFVLASTAGGMGYYFWRVTGDPFRMPYQVHMDTYTVTSPFIWQAPRPEPTYRHEVLRKFYSGWEVEESQKVRSVRGFLQTNIMRVLEAYSFLLGPVFALPLLFLPWVLRDRRMRILVLVAFVSIAGLLLEVFFIAHYIAPMVGLLYAFVLQGMRHMRLWRWRGRRTGLTLVRVIPLIWLAVFAGQIANGILERHHGFQPKSFRYERARILEQIQGEEGLHLAIVRYKPDHDVLARVGVQRG